MTSATLSTGGQGGFRHFQERLGLTDCHTLQLGSPFNFREQVELHLFRDMPDPSADPDRYEEAVLAKIPEYVDRTKGRAFVLFTSYAFLQRTPDPTESDIRWAISGNLCRCTGYVNIVKAIQHAAATLRDGGA